MDPIYSNTYISLHVEDSMELERGFRTTMYFEGEGSTAPENFGIIP